MYEEFWNLHSTPFDGNGWFYESTAHEEAAARLHFLIERRRPCGLLTGPAGTGKTTLLAQLTDELLRSQRHIALLDLYGASGEEILWQIVDCLHLAPPPNTQPFLLWRRIRDHLYGQARAQQQTVIIFDHSDTTEASALTTLEQLLRISDEAGRWNTMLIAANRTDSLRHLATWTDLRIELTPLGRQETAFYIYESLKQAGAEKEIFEPQAVDAIFAFTGGIPRSINQICELSLLAGMADRTTSIDAATVNEVARNLPLTGAYSKMTTTNAVA